MSDVSDVSGVRTHGTRGGYVRGCRCEPCATAAREYYRAYYRDYRLPLERTLVDPAAAARHLAMLRRHDMGLREISKACGVAYQTLQRIRLGRAVRGIHRTTRDRILTVAPAPHLVAATGAARRCRALAAIGWTDAQIAEHAGINERVAQAVKSQAMVTRAVDDAIRATYRALSMTLGPSPVARQRAEAKGWPPPLAWDDADLDAPAGMPADGWATPLAPAASTDAGVVDDAVLARVLAGSPQRTSRAEREQLVPELAARGLSDAEIAVLCGCSDNTVLRLRTRLNVPTWYARANRHHPTKGKAA